EGAHDSTQERRILCIDAANLYALPIALPDSGTGLLLVDNPRSLPAGDPGRLILRILATQVEMVLFMWRCRHQQAGLAKITADLKQRLSGRQREAADLQAMIAKISAQLAGGERSR
ncbi:hypothetical protein JW905_11480, partial [bacterium]|nr:hypothetical protein [candidate division CSSED10-310 bacterium]